MQACYADNATFNDEAFLNLNSTKVKAMWEMFCTRGGNLKIEFQNVKATDHEGSAQWTATYVFSATGRHVVNVIQAHFLFEEGKISQHKDRFPFYTWARQAFGAKGLLLGWTPFFQKKVQAKAAYNLQQFMAKKKG